MPKEDASRKSQPNRTRSLWPLLLGLAGLLLMGGVTAAYFLWPKAPKSASSSLDRDREAVREIAQRFLDAITSDGAGVDALLTDKAREKSKTGKNFREATRPRPGVTFAIGEPTFVQQTALIPLTTREAGKYSRN